MSRGRVSISLNEAAFRTLDRPGVTDEKLSRENLALTAEVTKLRLRVIELERAADTDPLVPVFNRRAFMREVSRAQSVMDRYQMMSSLIFFDLNGFKPINDKYGHGVGDTLLKKIGRILRAGVRDCDMVARLGGDEFGVLLFKSTPDIAKAKAAALACRISEQIIELPTGDISVSAAWGVAPCDPGDTAEQILDRADRAMYMAKRGENAR